MNYTILIMLYNREVLKRNAFDRQISKTSKVFRYCLNFCYYIYYLEGWLSFCKFNRHKRDSVGMHPEVSSYHVFYFACVISRTTFNHTFINVALALLITFKLEQHIWKVYLLCTMCVNVVFKPFYLFIFFKIGLEMQLSTVVEDPIQLSKFHWIVYKTLNLHI